MYTWCKVLCHSNRLDQPLGALWAKTRSKSAPRLFLFFVSLGRRERGKRVNVLCVAPSWSWRTVLCGFFRVWTRFEFDGQPGGNCDSACVQGAILAQAQKKTKKSFGKLKNCPPLAREARAGAKKCTPFSPKSHGGGANPYRGDRGSVKIFSVHIGLPPPPSPPGRSLEVTFAAAHRTGAALWEGGQGIMDHAVLSHRACPSRLRHPTEAAKDPLLPIPHVPGGWGGGSSCPNLGGGGAVESAVFANKTVKTEVLLAQKKPLKKTTFGTKKKLAFVLRKGLFRNRSGAKRR